LKLATIRTGAGTTAVRVEDDHVVELDAADVGDVLRQDGWQEQAAAATGARRPIGGLDFAPVVTRPDKVLCVGLNYRSHILEMGRELPEHPTLFAKFASTLIGAHDDIALPPESELVDWEAELAVIIGRPARRISVEDAHQVIAGYAVLNDVSVRDWQYRTLQWLQGKAWEATTPLGPYLVTADEAPGPSREIVCEVAGEQMQKADTSDLVHGPAQLVAYVSTILTLAPGDVIATGTPGGVGAARTPPRFLADGEVVVTRIEGLGECRNRCRRDRLVE
jgi:acylpyruvate hydrolase